MEMYVYLLDVTESGGLKVLISRDFVMNFSLILARQRPGYTCIYRHIHADTRPSSRQKKEFHGLNTVRASFVENTIHKHVYGKLLKAMDTSLLDASFSRVY
jgi:hypothetical protein